MPLLKTWKEENGRWGIWQVTETMEELCACLSDDVVRQELERLKAPSRKMECLAVRVLLKTDRRGVSCIHFPYEGICGSWAA